MIKAMRDNIPLRLFTDEFRTPVSGRAAVQGLLLVLEKVKGIIHLGGRERISRYDFGVILRSISGIRQAKFIPCRQRDIPMPAPRPPDVSLDSERAYQMGFKPVSIVSELTQIWNLV
jgi:dTDP-4-dehydrorhamnose reductase